MKTLLQIIIMITFSGIITPTLGQGLQSSDAYFNSSANLFIDNKHDEALNMINDGLQHFPDDPKLNALANLINEEKQKQDQQQKDKEKKEQEKKEQEKKEQEQKEDQEQEQKDQQQQQQNQQKQDQKSQQQKQQSQQITKQDAEQMLEALKNNEKKTIEKIKLQQMQKTKGKKIEKDW